MTQEDKELLLKDLCARLPYGVKYNFGGYDGCDYTMSKVGLSAVDDNFPIDDIKPYLFPLSSMTEEQKKELNKKFNVQLLGNDIYSIHYHSEGCWDTDLELDFQDWLWFINWCYKNHFDVNKLIEKGLAIDATDLGIY